MIKKKKKNKLCLLGKAINHFMVIEAISWYRLSMMSGVCEASLTNTKYGRSSPNEYTMERIAKALNVKHSDIVLKKEEIENEQT